MKKLLLTLPFITPFSAQALPLFEIEQTQTKLEFTGSLRVNISGSSTRTTEANGNATRERQSPAFTNDSSRFGFKLTQGLGNMDRFAINLKVEKRQIYVKRPDVLPLARIILSCRLMSNYLLSFVKITAKFIKRISFNVK